MMRRSFTGLVAVAGKSVAKTGAEAAVLNGASSDLAVAAKPKHAPRVEVAEAPPSNFVPPASVAPELLQAYVEPKPFVSARRLQLFVVSTAVGACTVAIIYVLLSKSISANAEEEQASIDAVAEKNRLAAEARAKLFPDFAAPSSYDQLRAKMEQRDREMARQEEQILHATSMLNTEIVYHVKMWWNRCLTNIQDAVDRLIIAQHNRQDRQVRANIDATLRYNGYRLLDLTQQQCLSGGQQ